MNIIFLIKQKTDFETSYISQMHGSYCLDLKSPIPLCIAIPKEQWYRQRTNMQSGAGLRSHVSARKLGTRFARKTSISEHSVDKISFLRKACMIKGLLHEVWSISRRILVI